MIFVKTLCVLLLAMLLIILKQILYFCHCVSVCPPKSLNYLLLKTFTFLSYLCDSPSLRVLLETVF